MRWIFVFGMPRSGTTWIGKVFDSHPQTLYRHEPDSVKRLTMPMIAQEQDGIHCRDEALYFLKSLPSMRAPKVVGKMPLFEKDYQSSVAFTLYRASALVSPLIERVKPGVPFLFRPVGARAGPLYTIWKSIESLGRLPALMAAVPDAKGIHIIRHPCGYIASVLRGQRDGKFGGGVPAVEDFGWLAKLLETPVGQATGLSVGDLKKASPAERLAWEWCILNGHVLSAKISPRRLLTVRLEDMSVDPIPVAARMFAFCGLPWHKNTERFIKASTQAHHKGYYSVYKDSKKELGRWRSELDSKTVESVMAILAKSDLHSLYHE